MSTIQNYLLTVSFIAWLIIIIIQLVQNKQRKGYWVASIIQILLIPIIAKLLNRYLGYFSDIQEMGTINISENMTLVSLYISMTLGMVAHHVFVQVREIIERPSEEKGTIKLKIVWFPILMPLVVSPFIFLSVLSLLQKMGTQATTSTAVVTQCILAFQNGFFWKTIFGHVQKSIETTETERKGGQPS